MANNELMFPVLDPSTLPSLQASHNLVQIDSPGNQGLWGYKLILPKSWVQEVNLGEQQTGMGSMIKIGLFGSHVGPDATILIVYVTPMAFEIPLQEWVQFQAARTGTRLLQCKPNWFAIGPVVDAGGLYGNGANEHVVRLIGHVTEGRIFIVSAMVRRDRYAAAEPNITLATNSFRLLRPGPSDQLEQWTQTSVSNPGFVVAHPGSWTGQALARHLPGKSGADISLFHEKQLMGYLRVKAIDSTVVTLESEQHMLHDVGDELKSASSPITVTGPWKKDTDATICETIKGVECAYLNLGRLAASTVELRWALVRRGTLVFAVTLVSVRKEDDAFLWMRSKRAFEIALMTAHPE